MILPLLLLAALLLLALPAHAGPPLRIVPQITPNRDALHHPAGKYAITRAGPAIAVVDLKADRIAWLLYPPPTYHPHHAAHFALSHDASLLALTTTTSDGGHFLNLNTDTLTRASWLIGGPALFAPDNKSLYVAANARTGAFEQRYATQIHHHDLATGKILHSFPLDMNMVSHLTLSPDHHSLIITGGIGKNLQTRGGGTFTPVTQTIHLPTQKSTTTTANPTRSFLNDLHHPGEKPLPKLQTFQPFEADKILYDPSTKSLTLSGQDATLYLWQNLAEAKSLRHPINGILRDAATLSPGKQIGTVTWSKELLPKNLAALNPHGSAVTLATLLHLNDGSLHPLPIPADHWKSLSPSPNGKFLAAHATKLVNHDSVDTLEIYDLATRRRIAEISRPDLRILRFQWTADANSILLDAYASNRQHSEFFTPAGKSDGAIPDAQSIYRNTTGHFTLSPSGNRIVHLLPPNGANPFRLSIQTTRTGEVLATISETLRPSICFLDENKILIADGRQPVRLLEITSGKILWQYQPNGSVSHITCPHPANAVILHYHTTGADILNVHTGQPLHQSPDSLRPAYYNPTLIDDNKFVLDLLPNSSTILLKDTATAKPLKTFLLLQDNEWLTHTPDGHYTASSNALRHIAFYRGKTRQNP